MTERAKIIEVMARAAYEHEWSKITGFTPWKKTHEQAYWIASMEAAFTAYESHLHTSGMAVVPVEAMESARRKGLEEAARFVEGSCKQMLDQAKIAEIKDKEMEPLRMLCDALTRSIRVRAATPNSKEPDRENGD